MHTAIEALAALRAGKKIRRSVWLPGLIIVLEDDDLWFIRGRHKWSCGRSYNCSLLQFLEDDWEILDLYESDCGEGA